MITRNAGEVIGEALESIQGLYDELLVADDNSTDGTRLLIKQYGGKIFTLKGKNLGERKQWLVNKAKSDWILVLDADERISKKLKMEIQKILRDKDTKRISGYKIPYQNYVFGKSVFWGGERYNKVRLFRKGYGKVTPVSLHEEVIVRGKIGVLHGAVHHYSFRTPIQLFTKFTKYAWIASREKKQQGESLSFAKLFLYGLHMFWARYVKDKGYKDGWRGLILALAFAHMEGLTYWLILV